MQEFSQRVLPADVVVVGIGGFTLQRSTNTFTFLAFLNSAQIFPAYSHFLVPVSHCFLDYYSKMQLFI